MRMIDVEAFRGKASSINSTIGRFKKSSLHPIFQELGSSKKIFADLSKLEKLQEMVFQLPYEKQKKYQIALDILKIAGIKICGRPCEPVMEFVRFDQGAFMYVSLDENMNDQLTTLEPGSLHHVFDFKWKSTTGNMQSLADVWTREHVKFRTSQQSAPFNDAMPPDMEFYWGQSRGAQTGVGRDDHSIKPPKLVCRFPWTSGENIAEQWYQYSLDGQNWKNIPGAAYLLTKGVRKSKGKWVFYFRKSNWEPHNKKRYKFEAEYPLGNDPAPTPKPGQKWNRTNGTLAKISDFGRLISLA